jgi:hypothetical protein
LENVVLPFKLRPLPLYPTLASARLRAKALASARLRAKALASARLRAKALASARLRAKAEGKPERTQEFKFENKKHKKQQGVINSLHKKRKKN